MAQNPTRRYKSTESKYKGGAKEMYVTYDLKQKTRGNGPALYHKIKRVYIAGDVTNWESGEVQKRSGRQVSGVLIDTSKPVQVISEKNIQPNGLKQLTK